MPSGFFLPETIMGQHGEFVLGYVPGHLKSRFCPRIMRIASQEHVWFSTKGLRG